MTTEPQTTPTRSKELLRPMPLTWWLKNPAYTRFMIRDVTSVFIAGYCVFLMVLMSRARDAAGFEALYKSLASPWSVVLHLIVLAFAVYHSITFFNLTPRVLVVFRGEEKVPESAIAGGHYALWALVSLVLLVIAFWVA
jgi:fumarate reductase subunit C